MRHDNQVIWPTGYKYVLNSLACMSLNLILRLPWWEMQNRNKLKHCTTKRHTNANPYLYPFVWRARIIVKFVLTAIVAEQSMVAMVSTVAMMLVRVVVALIGRVWGMLGSLTFTGQGWTGRRNRNIILLDNTNSKFIHWLQSQRKT